MLQKLYNCILNNVGSNSVEMRIISALIVYYSVECFLLSMGRY